MMFYAYFPHSYIMTEVETNIPCINILMYEVRID